MTLTYQRIYDYRGYVIKTTPTRVGRNATGYFATVWKRGNLDRGLYLHKTGVYTNPYEAQHRAERSIDAEISGRS